jgi:hypothetical protein
VGGVRWLNCVCMSRAVCVALQVSVKVSLLNFFVTPEGLEDQLLGTVVTQVCTCCLLNGCICPYKRLTHTPHTHSQGTAMSSTTAQHLVLPQHVCWCVLPAPTALMVCLAVCAPQERPDLANLKSALVVSNAKMKAELAALEGRILGLLSASSGNILDDEELIDTLAQAKVGVTSMCMCEGSRRSKCMSACGGFVYFSCSRSHSSLAADMCMAPLCRQRGLQWSKGCLTMWVYASAGHFQRGVSACGSS